MKYLRKTESGLYILHKDERKYAGCCNLHWLPAVEYCDEHVYDDGPGILMKSCTNCWYYDGRSLKYKKIGKEKGE